MGVEVFGERAQDAAEHLLFLDGQEAAVAVGDLGQPVIDGSMLAFVPRPAAMSSRAAVIVAGAELAGWALSARLDPQEARERGATSTMHAVSS